MLSGFRFDVPSALRISRGESPALAANSSCVQPRRCRSDFRYSPRQGRSASWGALTSSFRSYFSRGTKIAVSFVDRNRPIGNGTFYLGVCPDPHVRRASEPVDRQDHKDSTASEAHRTRECAVFGQTPGSSERANSVPVVLSSVTIARWAEGITMSVR